MMDWGNYLNNDVLEISMYEVVDRDGPLHDNEPIYESCLHIHDANKTKALSCVLTVKLPFSHVEIRYHGTLAMFYTWDTLNSCHYKILQLSQCSLWSKYNIFLQWMKSVITSFILNWLYSKHSNTELYNKSPHLCYHNLHQNYHIQPTYPHQCWCCIVFLTLWIHIISSNPLIHVLCAVCNKKVINFTVLYIWAFMCNFPRPIFLVF